MAKRVHRGYGHAQIPNLGTCSPCNRRAYASRDTAKQAAKLVSATGNHEVKPYRCPHIDGTWHIGTGMKTY